MKKVLSILLIGIMLLSLTACGGEKGVRIVNDLGYDLLEVSFTPSSHDFWGDDLLPSAAEDGSITVMLSGYEAEEGETFDLRAVDVDEYVYEFYDMAISDGDTITMSWPDNSDPVAIITPAKGDPVTVPGIMTIPEPAPAEFLGCWKYDDYDMYVVLYEDMSWQLLDGEGATYMNPSYVYEDSVVYLLDEDGSDYLSLFFDGGVLTDSDGDTLSPSPWPTGEGEARASDVGDDDGGYSLGGAYDNDDEEMSYVFYSDGTVVMSDFEFSDEGTYTVDGDYILMEFEGQFPYEAYYDSSDDSFQVDGLDGWFYYFDDAWYPP